MGIINKLLGADDATGGSLAVAVEAATKAFLTAQASLREADAAWLEALADEQLGSGTEAEVAAAEKDLGKAQNNCRKAEAALNAVKTRQDAEGQKKREAEAKAAAKAQAEPWNRAVAIAEDRAKAVEALAQAAASLATAYQNVVRLSSELVHALPMNPDMDAAKLRGIPAGEAALAASLRFELHQLGMTWTGSAGWTDPHQAAPDFVQPYRDTPGLVKKWKNQALGRG